MIIYLVRHGESMSNINKAVHKTTADHEIPLSPNGISHAQIAGRFIREHLERKEVAYPKVRLWTSPYRRTRQTADEIAIELHDWGQGPQGARPAVRAAVWTVRWAQR